MRLFYRPDIDKAVAATKAAALSQPRRGRKPKALSAPSAQQTSMPSSITQPPPASHRSQQPASPSTEIINININEEVTALRTQLQAQAASINQLQAELALLKHQLDTINQKQMIMAEQLPQTRIIEILSRFASFDQFTLALKKLNSQINKLSVRLADNSIKSKTKLKSKIAIRANKSQAKAAPRSKGEQKSRPSAPTQQPKRSKK